MYIPKLGFLFQPIKIVFYQHWKMAIWTEFLCQQIRKVENVASIALSSISHTCFSSIWPNVWMHQYHLLDAERHKYAFPNVRKRIFCLIDPSVFKTSMVHSIGWFAAWMWTNGNYVPVMISKRISTTKNVPNGIWRANHVSILNFHFWAIFLLLSLFWLIFCVHFMLWIV